MLCTAPTRLFAGLPAALALQRKHRPSNRAVFNRFRYGLARIVADRYRDGCDMSDHVGLILDVDDPLVLPVLRDVAMAGEDPSDRTQAMVIDRHGVAAFFGVNDKAVRRGVRHPSELANFPVFVVANQKISLHRLPIDPLRWVGGGVT